MTEKFISMVVTQDGGLAILPSPPPDPMGSGIQAIHGRGGAGLAPDHLLDKDQGSSMPGLSKPRPASRDQVLEQPAGPGGRVLRRELRC